MHNIKKMAMIKMGDFSHINNSLHQVLKTTFPGIEVEIIDLFSDSIIEKDALTIIYCFVEYGADILLGRKTISETYLRTPYMFKKVKQAVSNKIADKKYAFTLQTQSIFDLSVPGTPHFIYTDHTHLENLRYPGFNTRKLCSKSWIECEKTIYQNAAAIFTMSSNISRSVVNEYYCSSDKVSCVYCGSNAQSIQKEEFDESRFALKNILFVGIDWQRKGGPILVEAFKTVLRSHPDATLTILGCQPDIDHKNVNIVGKVPLADVKKYFDKASVFCLPTTLEPFGVVFLEAMAHRLPVVGTNIGAIPDFIHDGKNGYLVEPNDSFQLAQKLLNLLDSPDKCKSYGEYGHKLFWERYTWEKTGVRMKEQIERFLV